MLFSEMVQEVKNIVQDSSFDDAIPGYVNEAFLQASGEVNVPDLKRIGVATTNTDQMFVSLAGIPDGFGGRLSKFINNELARFNNVEDLVERVISDGRILSEVGGVEYVALEGRTLWYFPTPATEVDLQCVLFSNPPVMEADDEPLSFPAICHRNIGIHGACYLAFLVIEDGIEGDKVNTNFHYTMYTKGIQQLVEWIGRHRVHMITSTMNDTVATSGWNSSFPRWRNAG